MTPSISADGNLIAFASDRPGGAGDNDIYLYNRSTSSLVALPGLNSAAGEWDTEISPDGRYIAFTDYNRTGGLGSWDIYVYDRNTSSLLSTPSLNSSSNDELRAVDAG
jgi:Tol biopolymer transport system component